METGPPELTREELYHQVWTTPIHTLAKQYGISDGGLVKVCEHYDVPRPPMGYWSKKQFGKEPPQPSLPKIDDPELAVVRGLAAPSRSSKPTKPAKAKPSLIDGLVDPELRELMALELSEELKIRVAASLCNPHPLVLRTMDGMAIALKQEKHYRGHVPYAGQVNGKPSLSVAVTKEMIPRAMRIMDAIIKSLENRKLSVKLPSRGWGRTSFQWLGMGFYLRLREPTLRKPHLPTAEEQDRKAKYQYIHLVPDWDYLPSGKLVLEVFSDNDYLICSLKDGTKLSIEENLNRLFAEIIRQVDHWRKMEVQRAEEKRQQAEAEKLRRAEEERRRVEAEKRQAEQQRRDLVVFQAEQWQKSMMIRAFADWVRDRLLKRDGTIEKGSSADQWLGFVEEVAFGLEPIRFKPAGSASADVWSGQRPLA